MVSGTCIFTGYSVSDASAFTINEVSRKKTSYSTGGVGGTTLEGFYCTYSVKTLKVGTYTITGNVRYTYVKNSVTNYTGTTIKYNVVVKAKPVVTSITIPSSLTLSMGDSYTFSPVIAETGASTTLTWTSSNSKVASITSKGVLKALTKGNTTITCTASNGVSAQCHVTVNPIKVTGITLNNTSSTLQVGDKLQLTATAAPINATDKSVTWSSGNGSVATVDSKGLVTAVASGTTQIKATANDGSGKSAVCTITVDRNNKLTISDMKACKGGSGTLHVVLTDEDIISGFQFDLVLPDGITVSTDANGKLVARTTSRTSSHTISSRKVSDGLYRFVVVSMSGSTITKDKGDVMTISLDVADSQTCKNYDITIKDVALTVKDGSSLNEEHPRDNTAKLTVTDVVPGDVTGDGIISVTDVVSIISYVLEEEPTSFLKPAADLNGDGNITVTDAATVIDMILDNQ